MSEKRCAFVDNPGLSLGSEKTPLKQPPEVVNAPTNAEPETSVDKVRRQLKADYHNTLVELCGGEDYTASERFAYIVKQVAGGRTPILVFGELRGN